MKASSEMESNAAAIRQLSKAALEELVERSLRAFAEEEALAVLGNRFCTAAICQLVAQNHRLASFYSVRSRLVAHPATPQAAAMKLVHYLYSADLLRLSADVRVPAPVRRAIDKQLATRLQKMTLGEKVSAAKRCSRELISTLLFDPSGRVFASLLLNPRLREDDLLAFLASGRATPEKATMIGNDPRWSSRYAIRFALVTNPATPRAVAASQLRYLRQSDLESLRDRADTSVYLQRCIERMLQMTADDR